MWRQPTSRTPWYVLASLALLAAALPATATATSSADGAQASSAATDPHGPFHHLGPDSSDRWRAGECRSDRGVTVVVDFRSLGAKTIVRCYQGTVGRNFSGLDALRAVDVKVKQVQTQPGFVCRLQGRPGPKREDCVRTPPASRYWSYWRAPDGGPWTYSQTGAGGVRAKKGGFEGWSFKQGSGSAKPPRHRADRPGRVAAAPRARPAPTDPDASAARAAARWLAGDVTGGRRPGPVGGTDWGLSIDALLALAAAGVAPDRQQQMADALTRGARAYLGPGVYGDDDVRVAGAVAKVLLAAVVAGRDPADFGGFDLRAELLALQQDADGARPGMFSDVGTGADASNTVTQSLALLGLERTGGAPAAAVAMLADQQCRAGYFRLYAEQGARCADGRPGSAPDVDATAMAVQALLAVGASGRARRGLDWLVARQAADGSYGGGRSTASPNANSTGLAAQALAAGGRTGPATFAAAWLRDLALGAGRGARRADAGAIAYRPAELVSAQLRGIPGLGRDQWRRATAQAVLGLAAVPLATLRAAGAGRGDGGVARTASPQTDPVAADRGGRAADAAGSDGGVVLGVVLGVGAVVLGLLMLPMRRRWAAATTRPRASGPAR